MKDEEQQMVYLVRGTGAEWDIEDTEPVITTSFDIACAKARAILEQDEELSLDDLEETLAPLKDGTEKEVWVHMCDGEAAVIVSTHEILN